ncbi:tetratricopeptide repeat protein, partial [Methylomagnum sp.]
MRDQLSRLVALPRVVNARDCANFADFEAQLAEASAGADLVQIVGLDAWLREAVGRTRMEGFNLHRESLAQSCGTLLVLWLPVHLVAELAQAAPDFWEWRLVVVDFCVARAGVLPDGLEATLNRIHRVRRAGLPVEATALGVPDGEWGHARFNLEASRVEQASNLGRLGEALDLAEGLYRRAVAAGEEAYPNADLDLAAACWFFGRTLCRGGAAEAALPVLVEAEQRFERIEDMRPNSGAQRMATILALTELGNCLAVLGRYKRAVEVYERSISRAQKQGDARQVAIGKGQLGTVRLLQGRYSEALSIYTAARDSFAALDEPSEVAAAWHQIGRVHQETDDYAAA